MFSEYVPLKTNFSLIYLKLLCFKMYFIKIKSLQNVFYYNYKFLNMFNKNKIYKYN